MGVPSALGLGEIAGPRPPLETKVAAHDHDEQSRIPERYTFPVYWNWKKGATGSETRTFRLTGPGHKLDLMVIAQFFKPRGLAAFYRIDLVDVVGEIGFLTQQQVNTFQRLVRDTIKTLTGHHVPGFAMGVVGGLSCWENREA